MKQSLQDFLRAVLIISCALMVAGVVLHFSFGAKYFSKVDNQNNEEPVVQKSVMTIIDECKPLDISIGDKVAIIRVDDVQAYAWGETTRLMIDDALERNIPLTLGIIPKGFSDDVALVAFLKQRACNLEFALHGWNHQLQEDGVTPEFEGLDQETATARLTWGVHELRRAFGKDVALKTWIPPQNVQSEGTAVAAFALGFTRLSTEGTAQWDYDATSYAYDTNEVLPPAQVVAECEQKVIEDGTCIIMMHPQIYADDLNHNQSRYEAYYLTLLDELVAAGYSFARFEDLDTRE